MTFEFRGWRLYLREVKLTKGPSVTIYFFSRKVPRSGKPVDIPAGKAVAVHAETAYPLLTEVEPTSASAPTAYTFEGWGLYHQKVRDEDAGQLVDVMIFCRSQPKGFLPMAAPPAGRAGRWHPENDLPSPTQ